MDIYAVFKVIFKFLYKLFREAIKPPKVVMPALPPNPKPYSLAAYERKDLESHLQRRG